MAQVKFYAKAAMPSSNIDQNGIYFITTGGEIYKGATRFGCGRVTKASTAEELAALTGVVRGDINVGYQGAKVYDGSAWQPLGGDIDNLQASWRADISTWTSGLVAGGTGSIITEITQDADGKVTAHAEAFPTLDTGNVAGEIQLGGQSAKVSGWDTLTTSVTDLQTAVSDIKRIVSVSAGGAVNAASGTFTDLVVTSTATFSVTNVSASSLTINGSTVEDIADKQIAAISSTTATSTANGITVSVTTAGGSVTAVSVNATSFGNVMHFRDAVSNTANVTNPSAGDIVVIAGVTDSASTFKNGQEYIYTNGNTWELIGDQNTYAINAYSSTASVFNGVATVPGALNATGSAIDAINTSLAALGDASLKSVANTIDASATTLPTCSAIASYVSAAIASALTWITD